MYSLQGPSTLRVSADAFLHVYFFHMLLRFNFICLSLIFQRDAFRNENSFLSKALQEFDCGAATVAVQTSKEMANK
jgi:hypothetical protein